MDIGFGSTPLNATDADLLAVVVTSTEGVPAYLSDLDKLLGGAIARELQRGRVRPGKGDVAAIPGGASGPQRILLVGLGTSSDGRPEIMRIAGARIATGARAARASSVALLAPALDDEGADAAADLGSLVEGFLLGAYKFDRYKSSSNGNNGVGAADDAADNGAKASRHPGSLEVLQAGDAARAAAERAWILGNATNWTRDLANSPANHLTPVMLAAEAEALAARHEHMTYRSLDRAGILAAGMGLLAAVGQASPNEPRLIVLEWNPPGDKSPDDERLALIGKAVTFDTGGISIKPSAGMTDMRMDKSGGCAVLGGMRAIAELGIERRVLAVVGSAENMPGGAAYKPGDVITAMDGTTVEVTNTDAEGRLVLGDAICFARSQGCGSLVEISTLTGAMVVALGHHFAGLIARDGELTGAVLESAGRTGDHAWHLPMHDAYKDSLKSDIADMVNSGGRAGGSLYAGLFLERFARDTPFVHLDIAGAGMLHKGQRYYSVKGSNGWGVRLFADLAATR